MTQSTGLLGGIATGTRTAGIGLIGIGVVTALLPAVTGAPVMILTGLLLLTAGLLRAWFGWRSWSDGKGAMGLVLGALAAACGLAIVVSPVATLETVASIVAAYMALDGIATLVFATQADDEDGRRWMGGEALLSILLGASMWFGWPLSGVRALGVLLGAKLVSAGAVLLRVARGMGRVGQAARALRSRVDG